eukprot:gene60891-81192_t
MALKYSDYGYIMESGRVVMDGAASDLANNEDVKEFYLGVGGGERKSFKDVKSYKRRKRCSTGALRGGCGGFGDSATQAQRAYFIHNHRIGTHGMSTFYDALETRNPSEREAALLAALPAQVAHAQKASPAFAGILAGVDASSITSRAALAQLPVTRKYELLERQQAQRASNVFGGFSALGFGAGMPRVFASPGTIYEPEGT